MTRVEIRFRPETPADDRARGLDRVLSEIERRQGRVSGLQAPPFGDASLRVEWEVPALACVALAQAEAALRRVDPGAWLRVPSLPEPLQRVG